MAGYFLHCCASSVPSRGDRVEWSDEVRGKNWVLSSLAQSWGVYIEFGLPNWEGGKVCTDHGLCTLGWCTGGKPYSQIGNWWCIYTVLFLGKRGIILFPLFCTFWFPLFYFLYGCPSLWDIPLLCLYAMAMSFYFGLCPFYFCCCYAVPLFW